MPEFVVNQQSGDKNRISLVSDMNGDESRSSKVFGGGGRRSFVYSIVIMRRQV